MLHKQPLTGSFTLLKNNRFKNNSLKSQHIFLYTFYPIWNVHHTGLRSELVPQPIFQWDP